MNSSHTPLPPRTRIGCHRPSQRLKSPTPLTRSALGAHTANSTPAMSSTSCGCAPRNLLVCLCLFLLLCCCLLLVFCGGLLFGLWATCSRCSLSRQIRR